jgi:hypothetical protein
MRHALTGLLALALTCACGAEPGTSVNDGDEGRVALRWVGDGVEVRGTTVIAESGQGLQQFGVSLRWVIEDGPFPPNRTTGIATAEADGDGEFILNASERPPAEALVGNEATRPGVAVAYLMAYVDGDGNGTLDCRNPGDCADVQVGASPNAMLVFAEQAWPAEGEPLFGFNGASGVRPAAGWSLVHLTFNGPVARPTARAWDDTDTVELVIIGDFRDRSRNERRSVQPDVD